MLPRHTCSMPMISMLPPDLACMAILRSANADTRTLHNAKTLLFKTHQTSLASTEQQLCGLFAITKMCPLPLVRSSSVLLISI